MYEIPEMLILKCEYLNDTWNLIDFSKVVFTNVYLIMALADAIDEDDVNTRLILALAVFLAWIRLIGFLRLIPKTRTLIKMIIEITKDMIPFLAILLLFIFALTISMMALRQDKFIPQW
jgi:heme/copper-type cytochrome/quinol oxidase subunit 4